MIHSPYSLEEMAYKVKLEVGATNDRCGASPEKPALSIIGGSGSAAVIILCNITSDCTKYMLKPCSSLLSTCPSFIVTEIKNYDEKHKLEIVALFEIIKVYVFDFWHS